LFYPGVLSMFSAVGQLVFTGGRNFGTELLKIVLLHGQTRRAKSSSQPVNLPSAQPSIKPLFMLNSLASYM